MDMTPPRAKAVAKTVTVMRCRWGADHDKETGAADTVPYAIIMLLLCALSAVSAIKNPLAFAEIFGWM
jgi:hypothetical protein